VDIPAAHSTRFLLSRHDHHKLAGSRAFDDLSTLHFVAANLRESRCSIFLTCTKNTELTRNQFTRTFSSPQARLAASLVPEAREQQSKKVKIERNHRITAP
jgi:hypothetical protein